MINITNFVKIRVHILVDHDKHFMFDDGEIKWNPAALEYFYNADAKFRDPIISFINDSVGLHNWAIRFIEFYKGQYEVYIYCDNEDDFYKIDSIILDKLKNYTFRFIAKGGTVEDYIANK